MTVKLLSSNVDAQGFALESGDASSITQLGQSLQDYEINLLVSVLKRQVALRCKRQALSIRGTTVHCRACR